MRASYLFELIPVKWQLCLAVYLFAGGLVSAEDKSAKLVEPPSFKSDIEPLLKEKCWKCHGQHAQKGELALHTPDLIQKGSESGAVVIAGNSASSRLYEVIKHGEMPPDQQGTLTEAEVELFRKWIDAGAKFGAGAAEGVKVVTQRDVMPILLLRCTACHGRNRREAGLDLRSRDTMLKGGKSGPAFVSGKPDESLLLKRIRAEEMPPPQQRTEVSAKPMKPEEVKTLVQWIEQGAPMAVEEKDLPGTSEVPR